MSCENDVYGILLLHTYYIVHGLGENIVNIIH